MATLRVSLVAAWMPTEETVYEVVLRQAANGGARVGAESKAWHTAPVVMQVVDTVGIRLLAVRHGMPGGRVERYSLVLSDGLHTMEIKLITPLRHLVRDGCVRRGSVVRLLWYCTIFE